MNDKIYIGLDTTHKQAFLNNKIEYYILSVICNHFNISHADIIGHSRKHEFALPRMIAIYFMRKKSSIIWRKIAEIFSGRDHSTAVNAYETISDLLKVDKRVQLHVENIEKLLCLNDFDRK